MNKTVNDKLFEAASMVLEELCFLFSDETGRGGRHTRPLELVASVAFTGPTSGRLEIKTYGGLVPVIAANMMGRDDTTPEERQDAMGEFANVLCGNLLPELAGQDAVYSIQHPETGSDENESDCESAAEINLVYDEGDLDLFLYFDE